MNKPAKTVSVYEALIYAMVTMSAADTAMTDKELMKIGDIVKTVPIFRDFDSSRLVQIAEAGLRYLRKEDGLDEILTVIQTSLPARLYETAYALAIEVASADLHVEQEELRFLQMLRDQLELDKLVVAAIERSARVRYRVL
ncbi:MAG: tellurite resistance TerB family protein [Rhizobiales bacterium]|nr:tellurite resistance TerB family protein [Hyphomicrobiales bacterium]